MCFVYLFRAAPCRLMFVLPKDAMFHYNCLKNEMKTMEQRALKNVNNCLNTDIYSYLVTPGG